MDYFGSERRTCCGVVLLWVCSSIDRSVGAASELDANKVILIEIITILTVFLSEIEFLISWKDLKYSVFIALMFCHCNVKMCKIL